MAVAGASLLLLLLGLAAPLMLTVSASLHEAASEAIDSEIQPRSRARDKRYLDFTYGSPAYPDCVCGLAANAARSPRLKETKPSEGTAEAEEDDDSRVVGGVEAVPHSLPWLALLTDDQGQPICGGSVISDRYVISAAHCFDGSISQEQLKVELGEHDRCSLDRHTTRFSVERIIVHPNYRHATFYADIMLLRLSMRLTFNRVVRPVCLPTPGTSFDGAWAVVAGWGTSNFSGPVECSLQQAPIPVLPFEQCRQSSRYPPGTVHDSLLCAGLLGQGGRDSCQGDSGGPLQFLHPRTRRYTLIGIVSNGVGCGLADYPGLYTAVSHFVSWILTTTQDSAYCFR